MCALCMRCAPAYRIFRALRRSALSQTHAWCADGAPHATCQAQEALLRSGGRTQLVDDVARQVSYSCNVTTGQQTQLY
jgi:hypothetical protein